MPVEGSAAEEESIFDPEEGDSMRACSLPEGEGVLVCRGGNVVEDAESVWPWPWPWWPDVEPAVGSNGGGETVATRGGTPLLANGGATRYIAAAGASRRGSERSHEDPVALLPLLGRDTPMDCGPAADPTALLQLLLKWFPQLMESTLSRWFNPSIVARADPATLAVVLLTPPPPPPHATESVCIRGVVGMVSAASVVQVDTARDRSDIVRAELPLLALRTCCCCNSAFEKPSKLELRVCCCG